MILEAEKNKEATEDDKYRLIEDLDEATKEFNDQIKNLGEQKEKEIMSIS
jgi:ribosome recycling factor